ncbi:MAG: hypothetical protein WA718_22550, partial [Terriglobales bacterium]
SEAPLKSLALLWSIFRARNSKILWQTSQQIEGSLHGSVFFPDDDLIPSPKDLYFFALQPKLLWQPDRLTVSGTKNSRRAHAPTSNVYTLSIHATRPGLQEMLLGRKGIDASSSFLLGMRTVELALRKISAGGGCAVSGTFADHS